MISLLLIGETDSTHTRLCFLERKGNSYQIIHESDKFINSNFKNFASIIKDFLAEAGEKLKLDKLPAKACFAVASPVNKKNNSCTIINLDWLLNGSELALKLGIEKVLLLNYFEAVSYGILQLLKLEKSEDFETLQEGETKNRPSENTLIGVISVGTSLGEAFILKHQPDDTGTVYPSEGGHVDFTARSLDEFDLLEYITEKYALSRVSVERVVSEIGMVALYQFLRSRQQIIQPTHIDKLKTWDNSDSNLSKSTCEQILAAALQGDAICQKAMQNFTELFGYEVGNFALKLLPYEGLYIAGDIAATILQEKELRALFLEKLNNKGRMKTVIEKIPISLVKNKQVGLIGAGYYAEKCSM